MASSRAPTLAVHPVDADRWKDFERLFEARGGPSYCWCMAFRSTAQEIRTGTKASRKAAMKKRTKQGVPIGLLGYVDDEPVAWCSVAPRETFRNLVHDAGPDDGVWSVTCFYIAREHRGHGFTRKMLDAAVRHARAHGARLVEGYAVAPSSPSYRHMGFIPLFEQGGFHEMAREGSRRHVMQRKVRAGKTRTP